MHSGFTRPDHRGHRLHGIGMFGALQAFTSRGAAGLISIVEADNTASLSSCARLGYRNFGHIIGLRIFGRQPSIGSRGCPRYRFQLRTAAERPSTQPTTVPGGEQLKAV